MITRRAARRAGIALPAAAYPLVVQEVPPPDGGAHFVEGHSPRWGHL